MTAMFPDTLLTILLVVLSWVATFAPADLWWPGRNRKK